MWKTINEFPNYEINRLGQVRNIDTKVILSVNKAKGLYPFVVLWKHNKGFSRSVRKLVAQHFPS